MTAARKNRIDLTTGSVTKKLISFVLPVMAANLMQHLYNAADKAVVGQFAPNGEYALAALGSTGSAITLILNVFIGLSLGTNVLCSNLCGAGKQKSLRRAMHTSILLSVVCGIFVMFLGIFLAKPFLQLMGSPDTVIDYAVLYMRIYFVGVPFSLLYNFGAAILRANGDTKSPMRILVISGLINVILNMVFVIGCGMHVDGVGWATVISQGVSAAMVLHMLFKSDGEYGLNIKEIKFHKQELLAIFRSGIPGGINGMVFSISNVIVQSSINSLGDMVMAGASAADGISTITYQVLAAFYSAAVSFSGQCYGAKKYKRIDQMIVRSLVICTGILVVIAIVATMIPNVLLGLFTDNQVVMQAGYPKLITFCWGYIIYAVAEIYLGSSRGMRCNIMPSLLNVFCICIPRLTWVFWLFPMNRTYRFLLLCYPISWFVSAVAQGLHYYIVRRRVNHRGDQVLDVATT